jgi:hypothetical protein
MRAKCLTIHQPWAWAIIAGHQRVENRTWSTHYRGPLAIHAGVSREWMADELPNGIPVVASTLAFGAVIGFCDLVDCVPIRVYRPQDDPFASGPFCWMLENPRKLRPIRVRGQRWLWTPPEEVIREMSQGGRP